MGSIYTIEVPSGHRLKIEADTPDEALHAADSWKPDVGADVAADVGKSAAVGPVKAAIGMAGALPDVSGFLHETANKYLIDPLLNATIGAPSKSIPPGQEPPNINQMFGSENIRKKVEGVTGPLYEPKTPQGGYAQSVTEGVTGAMIGPGGTAMKIAQGVGSGLGSEALGNYFKGTLEPYARFAGGLLGGIGAGVGSKAVQGARNAAAAASAGDELGGMLGGGRIKGAAVDRVAKNIADEELTAPQAAARTKELGPNAMLMDLGHQLENRADFMAQHSGKAQNTVYKPLAERAEGIAPQLNAVLDKHLGESHDVVKIQNGIEEWSRKNVGPLYKALEEKYPVVNDARMQELAQRPAIQQAAKNAKTIAKDMGEELGVPETRTIISGPGYHIADDIEHAAQPSIRYWDFVKKSLDQRINGMMKGADESAAAQSTMAAVMQARRDLVRHLDNVTGGEYAQARKLASTKPAMEDALDLGRSIFNGKMLPEQLAEHLDGLSLAERRMVEIGVRREIEHRVGAPGDEGRKLRSLIGAPNNSAKLDHLLGPQANREIQNEISAADQFQRMKNKIEGTRTATRTAGMNDTTAPKVNLGVTATGLLGAAPGAAVNYALEHGFSNTRQDISRLLTAKGEKVNPVVQQLLNYNAKKARNEASPMGQQAAALIRALLAGGVSQ